MKRVYRTKGKCAAMLEEGKSMCRSSGSRYLLLLAAVESVTEACNMKKGHAHKSTLKVLLLLLLWTSKLLV